MGDLHIRIVVPLITVHACTEIGKVITPVLDLVAACLFLISLDTFHFILAETVDSVVAAILNQ